MLLLERSRQSFDRGLLLVTTASLRGNRASFWRAKRAARVGSMLQVKSSVDLLSVLTSWES